ATSAGLADRRGTDGRSARADHSYTENRSAQGGFNDRDPGSSDGGILRAHRHAADQAPRAERFRLARRLQLVACNLASRIARDAFDDLDVSRLLEPRYLVLQILSNGRLPEVGPLLRYDERRQALPVVLVRHTDHRVVRHVRMLRQRV